MIILYNFLFNKNELVSINFRTGFLFKFIDTVAEKNLAEWQRDKRSFVRTTYPHSRYFITDNHKL